MTNSKNSCRQFSSLFLFITLIYSVYGIRRDVRRLKPEDVGPLHTDAFEQLTKLYSNITKPMNKIDLMMDVSEIMEGYCDEDDTSCRNLAYEATMKEFNAQRREPSMIGYPNNFNPGMKRSIDQMFETIKQIDEHNVDEVVDTLNEISNDMKDLDDVNELHQAVALSALSVAVESTKLWHNVHYGEKEHPLRRLQSAVLSNIINIKNEDFLPVSVEKLYLIIIADTSSILINGVNFLEVVGTDNADAIIMFFPSILITLFYFSVPASMNAAILEVFNTTITIGGPSDDLI